MEWQKNVVRGVLTKIVYVNRTTLPTEKQEANVSVYSASLLSLP
jgi:hypothetical protein